MVVEPLKKGKVESEWLRCAENESEDNIAYINFLQTKNLILAPKLNRPEDDFALELISKHYPDYAVKNRIAQVDMREITKFDGALNCISWTTKE